MTVARSPTTPGQAARVSRGLNGDELRELLLRAVDRHDHHKREAEDLGRLNKTVDALEHIGLAQQAAAEAEHLADQITALGEAARSCRRTPASAWVTSR